MRMNNPIQYRVVANGTRELPYPAVSQWNAFYGLKEAELKFRESKRDPTRGRHRP